ncbi:MAG: hypothetical protein P4L71_04000 [Acetobacteraceae bacterium]|nr:hypothetical protein [Acetobacteraceae bacterium]
MFWPHSGAGCCAGAGADQSSRNDANRAANQPNDRAGGRTSRGTTRLAVGLLLAAAGEQNHAGQGECKAAHGVDHSEVTTYYGSGL